MIYLIFFGEIFVIFFPSLLILFLLLYAKRIFAFTKRSSGYRKWTDSRVFTGITYYYKYEICLADIFNCFGEIFAICFPSLLILFLLLYAKRTLVFGKRTSGSELILIYGNYFIFINLKDV